MKRFMIAIAFLPTFLYADSMIEEWNSDLNNPTSRYNLAIAYKVGKGIAKDHLKYVEHITAASELGSKYAEYELGTLFLSKGEGEQALKWLTRSHMQGFEKASFNLGAMYEYGKLVERDLSAASSFYKAAGKIGNDRLVKLKKKESCWNISSVKIIDTSIECSSVEDFHYALLRQKSHLIKKNNMEYEYQAMELFPGSSTVTVRFLGTRDVSEVFYKIPVISGEHRTFKDSVQLLAKKYGKPDVLNTNFSDGHLYAQWKEGGTTILIEQSWKENVVYLRYLIPRLKRLRVIEIQEQFEKAAKKDFKEKTFAY